MRGKQVTPLDLDLLHGLYARRIADEPLIALAQVVADKLGKQGLKLTKAELTEILDAIRANPLQFRLPPGRDGRLLNHAIEIDHIDIAVVEQAVINLEEEAPRIFEQMANDAASRVFRALKQDWPKRLRYEDDERARFKKHLYTKWKKPLDTMRHFLTISTELLAGYRERIDSDSTRQNLWELLTRLYARAIRTTEETYCLLSSGFSDGALSRWRTLHELAVVSHFMVIHGEEAATRYFDHQWVESKKRFDQLATPFWTSCIDAEFPRDRARVEAGYAAAIAKYGSPFRYDYGWAASGIGKDKPTFRNSLKFA
jgi:hypothetical protein